jgi:hypothetical protein
LNALVQFSHAVAFTDHCVSGNPCAREYSGDCFGIHGEKDYANAWQQVFQDRCGNDAVRPGHGNIEEDQIRFEFPGFLNRIERSGQESGTSCIDVLETQPHFWVKRYLST